MQVVPWIWSDIGVSGAVWGLLALGLFCLGLMFLAELRSLAKARAMVSGDTLLAIAGAFVAAAYLLYMGYGGVHRRHLERGEWRYTVGQVYENWRFKGGKESRFEFWVQGQRYRYDEQVDWQGGWKPLGSRWYVRYAVSDPDVHERTGRPVPDSLTRVPPAGWPRLPAGQ